MFQRLIMNSYHETALSRAGVAAYYQTWEHLKAHGEL